MLECSALNGTPPHHSFQNSENIPEEGEEIMKELRDREEYFTKASGGDMAIALINSL